MKLLVASALIFVGSCATLRHSEKIDNLKRSITYNNRVAVQDYLNTISVEEMETYIQEIASDKYSGRKTGETGHNKVSNWIRNYYISQNIKPPESHPNYYQNVPKNELPEGLNGSQNVIAYIEGSVFPDEYVCIVAHSDHEGVVAGKIYPGADDNGSGTAAVFEIAEAFNKAVNEGFGPKRSVVFLHVTGEEMGLHGSRYYTNNPIFPLANTVVTINIDMIGRVDKKHTNTEDYIYVIGANRRSTELHYIIQEANSNFTNLNLDYSYNDTNDTNRYFYRSDHYNFALKDIPVVFFFNGEHEDYTKPTDTADKINYPLLVKRTQLIFSTAWYIANSENRLNLEII